MNYVKPLKRRNLASTSSMMYKYSNYLNNLSSYDKSTSSEELIRLAASVYVMNGFRRSMLHFDKMLRDYLHRTVE